MLGQVVVSKVGGSAKSTKTDKEYPANKDGVVPTEPVSLAGRSLFLRLSLSASALCVFGSFRLDESS